MLHNHSSTGLVGRLYRVIAICVYFCLLFLCGCTFLRSGRHDQCSDVCGRADVTALPPASGVRSCVAAQKTNELLERFHGQLDLPMLLDIAFENSPNTKRTWEAAKIAEAQRGKAASVFFPKLTISGTAARTEVNTPPNTHGASTIFYPSVELQYSIFRFGGHANTAEAAKQLLCAAKYNYNRELQTLAHQVQRNYFLLDSAEAAVEASNKNFDDACSAYEAALIRHQAGLSSAQDFLQANANKSRAEFELENAKSKVEIARANLANVIGVMFADSVQIARATDGGTIEDLDISVHELINDTLSTRQDVISKRSVVAGQRALMHASYAKLGPELVIGASGDRKYYRNVDGKFDNYNVFASLRWTLFDGFYNIYDALEAKAKLRQSRYELQQLELSVAADVWAKYHAFKSAIKQLSAARNCEQASQESFDSIAISYKNGLSSFNDLMSAQNQLEAARQQSVIAKNNLSLSVVDLAYAVGIMNFDQKTTHRYQHEISK